MTQTPQANQAVVTAAPSDFGLRAGMSVEVLTPGGRLMFVGKVDSFRGGAIIIRDAKGDELPPVMYNEEVKLRFFREQGSLVFQGKICGSTEMIWKVDRLESKFVKEQRAFFRQRISTQVQAVCARRAVSSKPVPCTVLDVSAGGILIASQEEYQQGDRLSITGIRLTRTEDAFNFNCYVRRVGGREMGFIRYGCQFETLSPREQDRLLRAIFAVQREEIKNKKDR